MAPIGQTYVQLPQATHLSGLILIPRSSGTRLRFRPNNALDQLDLEYVSAERAVVHRPARVNAGIAAVHFPFVYLEPVRIRTARLEIEAGQSLSGLRVVLVEAEPSLRVTAALQVSGDQPDVAVLVERHVVMVLRRVVRDHELGLPARRIHAQDAAQPRGDDPQLAVPVLRAVRAATAEWNLPVAHRARFHVGLEDTVKRRVGDHPDVTAADTHPARIAGFGADGSLDLTGLPVEKPGAFAEVGRLGHSVATRQLSRQLLLADPQAFGAARKGVGKALRTPEQRR